MLRTEIVKGFDRRCMKIQKKEGFKNVFKVMMGYFIDPRASQEAKRRKIILVASYYR
jgi:hypothetical protein